MQPKYTIHTSLEYDYLRDTLEALVRPLTIQAMIPYFILPIIALIILINRYFELGIVLLIVSAVIFLSNLTSRKRYIDRVVKQVRKSGEAKKMHCKLVLYDECFCLTFKAVERTYTLTYDNISRMNEQGGYLMFGGFNRFDAILPKKDFDKVAGALDFFRKKCGLEGD